MRPPAAPWGGAPPLDAVDVAAALAAAIEEENAALRVLDVPRALALLPRKTEGTRQMRLAAPGLASLSEPRRALAEAVLGRLEGLMHENRTLLERAMRAQSRLIETLARAVPPASPAYVRPGERPARAALVSFSANA